MTDLFFAQCLSSFMEITTSSFTCQSMKTYDKISAELELILEVVCVFCVHIEDWKKDVDKYICIQKGMWCNCECNMNTDDYVCMLV